MDFVESDYNLYDFTKAQTALSKIYDLAIEQERKPSDVIKAWTAFCGVDGDLCRDVLAVMIAIRCENEKKQGDSISPFARMWNMNPRNQNSLGRWGSIDMVKKYFSSLENISPINFDRLIHVAVKLWDGDKEVKRLNYIVNGVVKEANETKKDSGLSL